MDVLEKRVLHGHIWSRPTNFIQCHCTFVDHRHSVSKVWARLDQGDIRYAQYKDFIDNSAMTLTLDTQTSELVMWLFCPVLSLFTLEILIYQTETLTSILIYTSNTYASAVI